MATSSLDLSIGIDQLGVLTTTRRVVEGSRYVHIDEASLAALAPGLARRIEAPAWQTSYHFVDGTERSATWLLVLDALNFSFWGEPRWRVEYRGELLNGYTALAAALTRAVEEGVPITDASYLATMTMADLAYVLRGEGTIPLLDRRLENLHEVGDLLLQRYDGSFGRAIAGCGGSAVRLVRLLVDGLVSFDDIADHSGGEVRFYKRAQILAADLHGAFRGESFGHFGDLDQLSAFADYKLPQILRHMGILVYIPSLVQKIETRFLLPAGSREEVEIRANTIWAVELLRRALTRHGSALRAFELDWWLWNEAQRFGPSDQPYHLARTIYY
ncbi:MAG TPA: queuosine salvage family protein [Chloroflexota bacterium]